MTALCCPLTAPSRKPAAAMSACGRPGAGPTTSGHDRRPAAGRARRRGPRRAGARPAASGRRDLAEDRPSRRGRCVFRVPIDADEQVRRRDGRRGRGLGPAHDVRHGDRGRDLHRVALQREEAARVLDLAPRRSGCRAGRRSASTGSGPRAGSIVIPAGAVGSENVRMSPASGSSARAAIRVAHAGGRGRRPGSDVTSARCSACGSPMRTVAMLDEQGAVRRPSR